MTTTTIVAEAAPGSPQQRHAVSGEKQPVGATAGQALDALSERLGGMNATTLIVVHPDKPFTAEQQARFAELITQ